MKILLFSDIHAGLKNEQTGRAGILRQNNEIATSTLEEIMPQMSSHHPDFIINMGDIILEDTAHDKNEERLHSVLNTLSKFDPSPINVIGNHDLRGFSKTDFAHYLSQHNLNSSLDGNTVYDNYQVIWLETELDNNRGFISNSSLELLDNADESLPTFIFSHYPIVPSDPNGTFYFEDHHDAMYYKNSKEIIEKLRNKNIIACFSAHCHWFSYKKEQGIHFITIPAFSENIAGMQYPENNPGVYSTLEINSGKILFKSFSEKFAFVNIELDF